MLKPILELLAGIPSIVYGYFALNFITPITQNISSQAEIYNAMSAGIAMGIMILPTVSSLSEDAMVAVPASMKNGGFALGATKYEIIKGIVLPYAFWGIISSFVLAVSRAIGETMIVTIAAGSRPTLTLNPLVSVQTLTAFIAQALKIKKLKNLLAHCFLGMISFSSILILIILLSDLIRRGSKYITIGFFTNFASRFAEKSGVLPALLGSIWIVSLTAIISVPIGIGAAIYLEEYAKDNWLTRFIKINIFL